jgi:hypothetical protein
VTVSAGGAAGRAGCLRRGGAGRAATGALSAGRVTCCSTGDTGCSLRMEARPMVSGRVRSGRWAELSAAGVRRSRASEQAEKAITLTSARMSLFIRTPPEHGGLAPGVFYQQWLRFCGVAHEPGVGRHPVTARCRPSLASRFPVELRACHGRKRKLYQTDDRSEHVEPHRQQANRALSDRV